MRKPVKVVYRYKNVNGDIRYCLYCFVGDVQRSTAKALRHCEQGSYTTVKRRLNQRANRANRDALVSEFGPDWINYFFTDQHIAHSQKGTKHAGGDESVKSSDMDFEGWFEDGGVVNPTGNMSRPEVQQGIERRLRSSGEKDPGTPFEQHPEDHRKIRMPLRRIWVTTCYILEDDTLDNVQQKICYAIMADPRFGKPQRLIPNRVSLFRFRGSMLYPIGYTYDRIDGDFWDVKLAVESAEGSTSRSTVTLDSYPVSKLDRYYGNTNYATTVERFVYNDLIQPRPVLGRLLFMDNTSYGVQQVMMLDLYSELSVVRERRHIRNNMTRFAKTYLMFFFPACGKDQLVEVLDMLDMLADESAVDALHASAERTRREKAWHTLQTRIRVLNYPTDMITRLSLEPKYDRYTRHEIVNQATLECQLTLKTYRGTTSRKITDTTLYHIFNTYAPTLKYIWIKLTTRTGAPTYKIFPNMPRDMLQHHANQYRDLTRQHLKETYGLVAKMYIEQFDRYVHITLGEQLVLRVRTQWNEKENMTFRRIETMVFPHVQDWVRKINADMLLHQRNQKHVSSLLVPDLRDTRFTAINANQWFQTPRRMNIQTLQRLMAMLYPYVKVQDNTGHKTLRMRYIRISEYNSKANDRLETYVRQVLKQRTDLNDNDVVQLVQRVTKLTVKQVMQLIRLIQTKYNVNPSGAQAKSKPPGAVRLGLVGVSIELSKRDRVDRDTKRSHHTYRLRCMGVQDQPCFERIKNFMSCMAYLLLNLSSKRLAWVQSSLKNMGHFVRILRRNQANHEPVSVADDKDRSNIKQLVWLDPDRFGYRPNNVNNSNFSRSCEKKKQPRGIADNAAGRQELAKLGYVIDPSGVARHKKTGIVLPRLPNRKGEQRWYWCPSRDYRYPGFLPLDRHPKRLCQPCCYKNLQSQSPTPHKQELYRHCMETNGSTREVNSAHNANYIFDRYHRIRKGRFGQMPLILDQFLNKRGVLPGQKHGCTFKTYGNKGNVLDHTTPDGVFVLLGMTIDNSFIRVCTQVLQPRIMDPVEPQLDRFKAFLISRFDSARPELFTSIAAGRYRRRFASARRFIEYCFSPGNDVDKRTALTGLISTPGVMTPEGLNCILFYGNKQHEDKDDIDIRIDPGGSRLVRLEPFRSQSSTILLLCFNRSYYPVVRVFRKQRTRKRQTRKQQTRKQQTRNHEVERHIGVQRVFGPAVQPAMVRMYERMYQNQYSQRLTATAVHNLLWDIGVKPTGQTLDAYFYCYGLVLPDMRVLPTVASEALPHLTTVPRPARRSWRFDDLWSFIQRIPRYRDALSHYVITEDGSTESGEVTIIQLCTVDQSIQVPVIPCAIAIAELQRRGLQRINIENSITTTLNKAILTGVDDDDESDEYLKRQEYVNELYNLVRFHVSHLLQNRKIRRSVQRATKDHTDLEREVRRLFKRFVVIEKTIDWSNYRVVNQRVTCFDLKKRACQGTTFRFHRGACRLRVPRKLHDTFVEGIVQEIQKPGIRRDELYRHHYAFIEDIIDTNRYDECQDCLLYQNNAYMQRGPMILRRLWEGINTQDYDYNVTDGTNIDLTKLDQYQEENRRNPVVLISNFLIQRIIPGNLSLFRAYANCFHWLNNPTEVNKSRNLGFVDYHQERLAIWFRGNVVQYLKRWNTKDNEFDYRHYQMVVYDENITTPLEPTLIALSIIRKYPIFLYDKDLAKPKLIVRDGKTPEANESTIQSFDATRVVHIRIIDNEHMYAMYSTKN